MIHALNPCAPGALCRYFFANWTGASAAERTTIRYSLVTCARCIKAFTKYPQLRNQAHATEKEKGETGTLAKEAGSEEAAKHWCQEAQEGRIKSIPPWARALYLGRR